eukprot:366310-Chlamydomonas_euryale.AAC.2
MDASNMDAFWYFAVVRCDKWRWGVEGAKSPMACKGVGQADHRLGQPGCPPAWLSARCRHAPRQAAFYADYRLGQPGCPPGACMSRSWLPSMLIIDLGSLVVRRVPARAAAGCLLC